MARVNFSVFSEMYLVPKDPSECKWYTEIEKRTQLRALAREAAQVSRELRSTQAETVSHDLLTRCLGVEALVNRDLARHTSHAKQRHIRAVLLEQRIQREQGISDPKKLSLVSMKSSQWSRNRAQIRATVYVRIGDDTAFF